MVALAPPAFGGGKCGVDPRRHVRAVTRRKPAIEQFDRGQRAVGELCETLLREAQGKTTFA